MRANLNDLLPSAIRDGRAVPCFNVFGIEDAIAVIAAAEAEQLPVIIATNLDMVEFMGAESLAAMLGPLAAKASVPVCVHLDHCYDETIVFSAIEAGYDSVMFDGSQLPIDENIRRCAAVVAYAKASGVSVEGEIGSVAYSEGRDHIRSELTTTEQAVQFATASGVHAVAVSVGNIHRLAESTVPIDFERLQNIAQKIDQPIVIHGASGICEEELRRLPAEGVGKLNIGTSLRQTFGRALREELAANPELFDRLKLFKLIAPQMQAEAQRWLRILAAR